MFYPEVLGPAHVPAPRELAELLELAMAAPHSAESLPDAGGGAGGDVAAPGLKGGASECGSTPADVCVQCGPGQVVLYGSTLDSVRAKSPGDVLGVVEVTESELAAIDDAERVPDDWAGLESEEVVMGACGVPIGGPGVTDAAATRSRSLQVRAFAAFACCYNRERHVCLPAGRVPGP